MADKDNPKILIVDDDDEVRTQMKWALSKQYEVLLGRKPQGSTGHVETASP
jgi:DNA-binding response OmpR family regulator